MEYDSLKKELFKVSDSLRKPNGTYVASNGPHYNDFSWMRDIYYQAKPTLKNDPDTYQLTYNTLTEYIIGCNDKYDNKLQWLIDDPMPINSRRFLHPRFHWETLTEITSNWGNVQLDTFGYYMLGVAEARAAGICIENSDEVVLKLIKILDAIDYTTVPDNAIWEEYEEVHASSIGAVIGGLTAYVEEYDAFFGKNLKDDLMIRKLIQKGAKTLKELLPRESATKNVDLALLTLIYPFNVVDEKTAKTIVKNVTNELERPMGVIRYKGDYYFNSNSNGELAGNECEWCMGFCYLSFAHHQLGNTKLGDKYFKKLIDIHELNNKEGIPEGYFSGTKTPNENSTLGWPTCQLIDLIDTYYS
jgi:GH15 family glucan-1,4-alpha-glucosidase